MKHVPLNDSYKWADSEVSFLGQLEITMIQIVTYVCSVAS